MKYLLTCIGAIAIAFSLPLGVNASSVELPEHVQSCLVDGANQGALRKDKVLGIDVFSRYETKYDTYLQASVVSQTGQWSFAIKYTDDSCSFIGDNAVNEVGLFGDMDQVIVKDWTIQDLERRLQVVEKKEIRDGIKASTIQWHPGQIEAFKELNLI